MESEHPFAQHSEMHCSLLDVCHHDVTMLVLFSSFMCTDAISEPLFSYFTPSISKFGKSLVLSNNETAEKEECLAHQGIFTVSARNITLLPPPYPGYGQSAEEHPVLVYEGIQEDRIPPFGKQTPIIAYRESPEMPHLAAVTNLCELGSMFR